MSKPFKLTLANPSAGFVAFLDDDGKRYRSPMFETGMVLVDEVDGDPWKIGTVLSYDMDTGVLTIQPPAKGKKR